jgi:hypothetical protein
MGSPRPDPDPLYPFATHNRLLSMLVCFLQMLKIRTAVFYETLNYMSQISKLIESEVIND